MRDPAGKSSATTGAPLAAGLGGVPEPQQRTLLAENRIGGRQRHLGNGGQRPGVLAPGGLAFQLPGNFDGPHHTLAGELASTPRWRALLADVRLNRQAGGPAEYAELLTRPGFRVDAWETTYLHVLPGENPVLEWAKGTTLRPVLAALDEEQGMAFLAEYADRIRGAYRSGSFGTFFPFRRVFTVVHRDKAGRQPNNSN